MTSKSKKKQIDFSVRPRANKQALPATADEWVQDGTEPAKPIKQEEGPQKRLTLNVPAESFDFVYVTCLPYLPEEKIDEAIKELFRLCRVGVLFHGTTTDMRGSHRGL